MKLPFKNKRYIVAIFLTILTVFCTHTSGYANTKPVFTDGDSATRDVAENTASSANIGTPIAATDADNDVLTYTLGGTDAASFSIVRTSGQLQTNVALDYETDASYSVTVSVSDGNGGSANTTVTIDVTDVGEKPAFAPGGVILSVAENIASGTNIGDPFQATDPDSGDTLTYSLERGDADAFRIDANTGQLRTHAALDYETKRFYTDLAVRATDSTGLVGSVRVTINVKDVPENNAPVFTDGSSTTRSVLENTASGENIGSAVAATDADNDTLIYTLDGTDAASFSIVSTTGQLQTNAALDYETKSSYSVSVSVSDGNGGSDSIPVTIRVTDVNETPANNAPIFTEGGSATRTIAENTALGQNIGTAVAATDADSDTLTYRLGGTDASAFSIVSTTGQLQTNVALDYETDASYSVTVSVSDSNGGSDSIPVTISVTNVNEKPYFAPGGVTLTVAENTAAGTNIGDPFQATDPDSGDTLTYSLERDDKNAFRINPNTGQLQTHVALDYETKRSYTDLAVRATDSAGLVGSILVRITVRDVNETPANNAPVFTDGTTATRTIAENTASGANIGSAVAATDADNDTLTYRLGGTDAASFSIVNTTGQLQTNAALDYETKTSYSVTVSVSDGNGGSDSITVTITVRDVDETPANNAPIFTDGTSTTRSVAENTAPGQNIGSAVAATDTDTGDRLTYRLGGTDAAVFRIISTSGRLQTSAALNYETKSSYLVTVFVSDGNGGSDSILVTINVRDVSEKPYFAPGGIILTVAENTAAGTNIGDPFQATDPDSGDTLTYSLQRGDKDAFRIDPNTGQLQTHASLDYETKSAYTDLAVRAVDSTGLIGSTLVRINVTDVAENNAPVFTEGSSATRTVAEDAAIGTNIGTPVAATDADNDTLTYRLGGTDAASFSIVNTTGQLRTRAALDYETKSSYSVTVSVSDGNSGSDSIPVTIDVSDVNERPPRSRKTINSAPVFTDGTTTARSIAENTASGTNIGSPIAATDADNDTLIYSLSGADAASFRIVSTTGQLQTEAALDYETRSSYTVTVSVSDSKGGTDNITVTIDVTDVDEIDPPLSDRTQQVRDAIVREAPVNSIDDVTIGHLAAITSLSLNGRGEIIISTNEFGDERFTFDDSKRITSLKAGDFNGLTSLTTLDLSYNSISDVSPLEDLTTLTNLNLGSNSISDISVLEDLTALEHLSLGGNSISDISVLEDLTALKHLNLGGNTNLNDISVLEDLTALEYLNLWYTGISDVSPLEDLTALEYLSLSSNSISDISVLEDLTALTSLSLVGNTNLNDISALEDLTALTSLNLRDTGISDISALEDLTALTNLDLSYNSISDVSALENLTSLRILDLDGNTVSDYAPLRRLIAAIEIIEGHPGLTLDITIPAVASNNAPVFTDGTSTTRSVAENTAADTNIGTAVSATDADTGDTLTYHLGGMDAASFSIVKTSGQLQTKAALDYETKTAYTVTVAVSDGKGGTDSITVTIDVTDEAAAAPSVELPPVIPMNTALLTNFPNPFNPETWIPYQLAEPAEVTLTIYDIRGVVVRELKLGHQAAGFYQSRSQAIYWDGRNRVGEKVASGLYFYTLTAGDFTATRKLLIRK